MSEERILYQEFDKIWDNVVVVTIKQLQLEFQEYIYSDGYEKKKGKAKRLYNTYKNIFLKSYMSSSVSNIDRHKIAACFTKALLVVKPFKINTRALNKAVKDGILNKDSKEKKQITFINEYLALSVVITILDSYILYDENKKNKHIILLPDPYPEKDDDYIKDVCLDLHFTNSKKINIVTLANVFFLLEKYSCRRAQCRNLKEEYKRLLLESGDYTSNSADDKIKQICLSPRLNDLKPDNNFPNFKTPIIKSDS